VAPVLTAHAPPLTTATFAQYQYQFRASGVPAPGYLLARGAPTWLAINSVTGQVSGQVPWGIGSFSYSVIAFNQYGTAKAGPYTVTVSHAPPSGLLPRVTTRLDCVRYVLSGRSGSCVLIVVNQGGGAATDVSADIALPARLHARSCGRGCTLHGNTAAWRLGALAPGQAKAVGITFTAWYQPARWNLHPIRVTVTGGAQWGQRVWWRQPASSYATARVTIFPRGRWTW
jgi:Putative Ig domain